MTVNNTASATAAAAISSPWWLPALHNVSSVAAELAPILGASFLAVQIASKLYRMAKGEDKGSE
jgi:hypothetical protein